MEHAGPWVQLLPAGLRRRANGTGTTTFHEATIVAGRMSERQLGRVERRLRRRHWKLGAAQLTELAAVRAVLRDRGYVLPPVGKGSW